MFEGLGNFADLMKNAQGRMQDLDGQLKGIRVTGNSGGGMVSVEMNANSEMVKISIDPSLFENDERGLIEELIPAAVNAAQQKAKQAHAEAVQSLAGGMDFSGLESLFGGGEAK